MQITKLFLIAAIAASAIPAMAQWQWIDARGQKVFSDRAPPTDIPAKNILRQPGAGASSRAAEAAPAPGAVAPKTAEKPAESGVDKGLEEQKRKQEQQEAEKTRAEQAKREKSRQENCDRAKQAKATLTSGRVLSSVNANGERGFMDEASRDAEVKRADAVIASECGPLQPTQ
ncbi:MAG: DUF4124 domain-containing protein [Comamonas sp.]